MTGVRESRTTFYPTGAGDSPDPFTTCTNCGVRLDDYVDPPGTRRVHISEKLFEALGVDRVNWGEPDEYGFYTPTLYRFTAADPETVT